MSIAGGLDRALDRARALGCEAVQLFLKNQLQWRGPAYDAEVVTRFREKARGLAVMAHASYLINLAAAEPRRSVEALIDELRRAEVLGISLVVVHPGSHLGRGEAEGLRRVARSLSEVLGSTSSAVRIALETTSGQGSTLGGRFSHFADILAHTPHTERLAVCLDTCHVFAAGYELSTTEGYERMVEEICREIGCERVVAFHLNDSREPCGSRRDRHAHIGRGKITLEGFRRLLTDPRWRDLPMVLETPKGRTDRADRRNLQVLRALTGREPPLAGL